MSSRTTHIGNDISPVLPHSLEAERGILGGALLDNEVLDTAIQIVRSSDFFLPQHRSIFDAMIQMRTNQQGIDAVTLMDALQRRDRLEASGGAAYLTQLADGRPRTTNVDHYARIVADHAARRRIIGFANALYQDGFDDVKPIENLISDAELEITRARAERNTDWRKKFHRVEELPEDDAIFLIDRILPEGVTFLGALSGVGKTWFALSMVRALTTGTKFMGVWNVPAPVEVLYLCPEMGAKSFKRRCKRFGISERFHCQTIADGAPLDLADPHLMAAIRELKPVVFLDTAIRFSSAEDENSASDNQELTRAIFCLLYQGARAVVCLHHRAKDAARIEEMTLENVLRGTSDLGAVSSACFGLRYEQFGGSAAYLKESRKLVRLQVRCVKARDFIAPDDFRVQLDPFIDEIGDMAVLTDSPAQESEADQLDRAISESPTATKVQLQALTGIGRNRISKLASEKGWHYKPSTGWIKTENGVHDPVQGGFNDRD